MNDQLQKLNPKTCGGSLNAISSQESEDGQERCSSQEYPKLSRCGRAVRRASLLAWLAQEKGETIHVTWLRPFSISSRSADLHTSLGNRLQLRLPKTSGLMLYSLNWKRKATPAGLPYFQLVASVLRTKEIDSSLVQSFWYTPTTNVSHQPATERGLQTGQAMHLAAWPTPTTRDHKDGQECPNVPTNSLLGREVWLSAWPTPTATNNDRSPAPERALTMYRGDGSKIQQRLQDFAAISEPVRITASGRMLTGSPAGIRSSGQLNPAHSRWLMGFPPAWDASAVTATPLCRKSPLNLSAPSSKALPVSLTEWDFD